MCNSRPFLAFCGFYLIFVELFEVVFFVAKFYFFDLVGFVVLAKWVGEDDAIGTSSILQAGG